MSQIAIVNSDVTADSYGDVTAPQGILQCFSSNLRHCSEKTRPCEG